MGNLKRLLNFFGGTWVWYAAGLLAIIAALAYVQHLQREVRDLRGEVSIANYNLETSQQAVATRDALIRQVAVAGGKEWTSAEQECLNAISRAYDNGVAATASGVPAPIRDRQSSGAFKGSVSR